MEQQQFTKYEIARIIGARALQVAMDAPLLLKISEDELKAMKYDALLIAEKEFKSGALPISISRPLPRRRKEKLAAIKEEKVSDEDLVKKEKEVEKEISADLDEYGLAEEEETTELEQADAKEEQ